MSRKNIAVHLTRKEREHLGVPARRVAKVTDDPEEAHRLVAIGAPAVLVGSDGGALAKAMARCGADGQGCLLGVVVGDLADQAVAAAAEEMAGELFGWADPGLKT